MVGAVDEPPYACTDLRWYFDSNVIDDPRADGLRRMRDLGWVELETADTTHTETQQNPDAYERLLPRMADLPISMGAMVVDHSVIGLSVIAAEEDVTRMDSVHGLISNTRFQADGPAETTAARTGYATPCTSARRSDTAAPGS